MKKLFLIMLSCAIIMFNSFTVIFAEGIISDPNEPLEYSYELDFSEEGQQLNPRADIIKWRYKTVNSHLYRRKYNYTKKVWIGQWERV